MATVTFGLTGVSLGKLNPFPVLPSGRMLAFLLGAASSIQGEDACNAKECCLEKKYMLIFSLNGRFEYFS